MSELDSRATSNIADETHKDAISMRTIAFVTLFFLPATFISAFFSMTFFQTGSPLDAKYPWLYFVAAIPMTFIVLGIWYRWHRSMQRKKSLDYETSNRNWELRKSVQHDDTRRLDSPRGSC